MLSSTDIVRQSCGVWNVRPMPVADARVRRRPLDAAAAEDDAALARLQEAREQVDERRLARAVRADQPAHLALGIDVETPLTACTRPNRTRHAVELEQRGQRRSAAPSAGPRTSGPRSSRSRRGSAIISTAISPP